LVDRGARSGWIRSILAAALLLFEIDLAEYRNA
jgi:hypothetical protein